MHQLLEGTSVRRIRKLVFFFFFTKNLYREPSFQISHSQHYHYKVILKII